MNIHKRAVCLIFVLLIMVCLSGPGYARVHLLPLDEIEVGMKGIGKTVISGTTIEEFAVEIMGILPGQLPNDDLILVQVSGPLIEKTGGIAAGMSGSPVYIDDKLIGAIGYSWGLTDHTLGLVTPIEAMLEVLKLDQRSSPPDQPLDYQSFQQRYSKSERGDLKEQFDQISFCNTYHEAQELAKAGKALAAYPVQTPLLVSGLQGRALTGLLAELDAYDITPVTVGASPGGQGSPPLQPGSAVAVQLVRGDINVSALGTLSYREGDQILAFGHPFLNLGPVEYFLSGAEVLTVLNQLEMPFKIGHPTDVKGVITQDRQQALAGTVNAQANMVPVNILVHDLSLQREREIQFQVIQNEELIGSLVINAMLQAIDSAIDRRGYGTSMVYFEIMGDHIENKLFQYSNMYYSSYDIAATSIVDLQQILSILIENPFHPVDLNSIRLVLDVARERQVAVIEEVTLLNDQLLPGDTAQILVRLRPYQREPLEKIIEVQIPTTIEPGTASLSVSSGAYGYYTDDYGSDSASDESPVQGQYYQSLMDLLGDYSTMATNNELIVEITPHYLPVMEKMPSLEKKDSPFEPVKEVIEQTAHLEGTADSKEQPGMEESNANRDENEVGSGQNPQLVQKSFQTDFVLEGGLTIEIYINEKIVDPLTEV